MNERSCQRRLAAVWLAGGGLILLLLVGQDLRNIYGGQSDRAWAWFGGTVLPTLSLMIGTFAAHARLNKAESDARVDPMAFYMALGLSIIFLLLVLATLLIQPLSASTPLQLMTRSALYLAPIQGLVGLALGAFFASRRSD